MSSEKRTHSRVPEGVRSYFTECNTQLMLIAALAYTAAAFYRVRVFVGAGIPPETGVLPVIAGALIAFGYLCTVLFSRQSKEPANPAAGIFILICGFSVLAYTLYPGATLALDLRSLADILTFASAVAFALMLVMLFASCYGALAGPWIGPICSFLAIAAFAVQALRMTVSFSQLYTLGGNSFDFSGVYGADMDMLYVFGSLAPDADAGLITVHLIEGL